jgi:peptidoglycan/xylan/chitin deacetylase (PgdA/CDA1 family)
MGANIRAVSQRANVGRRLAGRFVRGLHVGRWTPRDAWLAIVLHHLSDDGRDPLVRGLAVDTPVGVFNRLLDDLVRDYDVVTLEEALAGVRRRPGSRTPALLCFDDAYASVVHLAHPMLERRGLPWVFFVNSGVVESRTLALDNYIAYVANTHGMRPVSAAVGQTVRSLADMISRVLPGMGARQREQLAVTLEEMTGAGRVELAARSGLHATPEDLRSLANAGVEVGNHTADHVHCRALGARELHEQVLGAAIRLRVLTGQRVRAFAYPYGSPLDATEDARKAVRAAGHDCAFVVRNELNRSSTRRDVLQRVRLRTTDRDGAAIELAALPPLRGMARAIGRRP